jgi:hypothetical protein
MTSPWEELVALAERERDLVLEGRWEDLAAVSAERNRRSLALGTPGPDDREPLERLAQLQHEIHAGTAAARAFTLQRLGKLQHGRTAVRGYAGGASAPSVSRRA